MKSDLSNHTFPSLFMDIIRMDFVLNTNTRGLKDLYSIMRLIESFLVILKLFYTPMSIARDY